MADPFGLAEDPQEQPAQPGARTVPDPFASRFGVDLGTFARTLHSEAPPEAVERQIQVGRQQGMDDMAIANDAVSDAKEKTAKTYAQRLAEIEKQFGADPQAAASAKAEEEIRGQKMMRILAGFAAGVAGTSNDDFRKSLAAWDAEARRPLTRLQEQHKSALEGLDRSRKVQEIDDQLGAAPAVRDLYSSITGRNALKDGTPLADLPAEGLRGLLEPALSLRGQNASVAKAGQGGSRDPLSDAARRIMMGVFPGQAEDIRQIEYADEGRLIGSVLGGDEGRGGTQGRYEDAQVTRAVDAFAKESAKTRQTLDQTSRARAQVIEAVNNGTAAQALPTIMARLAGDVGALSNQDRAAFAGNPNVLQQGAQFLKKYLGTGGKTVVNAQEALDFIDVVEKALEGSLQQKGARHAAVLAQRRGMSPQEAWGYLLPEFPAPDTRAPDQPGDRMLDGAPVEQPPAAAAPPAPAGARPVTELSDEELRAELEALNAGSR